MRQAIEREQCRRGLARAASILGFGLMPLLMGTAVNAMSQEAPPGVHIMALPAIKPFTGDFDLMQKRRFLRILVPLSKTSFYLDKGAAYGVDAEFGQEFESWLTKRYGKKPYKFTVGLIPTPRDKLLTDLAAGKGDIAAGNLTITPERQALVDFAAPWASGVKEVLVTGPAAPDVKSIDDLGGKTIVVRKSSSYYTHLVALNARRKADHLLPVEIKPADENLEDEDLLEMVNSSMIPWIVVDRYMAKGWAGVLKNLTVHDDIVISDGGEIAWAVRKNSRYCKRNWPNSSPPTRSAPTSATTFCCAISSRAR